MNYLLTTHEATQLSRSGSFELGQQVPELLRFHAFANCSVALVHGGRTTVGNEPLAKHPARRANVRQTLAPTAPVSEIKRHASNVLKRRRTDVVLDSDDASRPRAPRQPRETNQNSQPW